MRTSNLRRTEHSLGRNSLTPPEIQLYVRQIVLSSGERLPLLCDAATGQPLLEPLLYALTELRARGRSTATIRHAMEAVMLLLFVLGRMGIDLRSRLRAGLLFDPHELDLIVRSLSIRMFAFKGASALHYLNASHDENLVARETAANRLLYIHSYLVWLTQSELLRLNPKSKAYEQVRFHFETACSILKARAPCTATRNLVGERQGLDEADVRRVKELLNTSPICASNERSHTGVRNSLIIRLLFELGIRRGELLGIKTSDIDFRQNTVLISRRADAKDDPRPRQPLTKTNGRLLPISHELADAAYEYICQFRKSQPNASRHEYLIVASYSGRPLSLNAVNKVFVTLRKKVPELSKSFTPHVLRHTWNDRFSETMDEANLNEEQEKKIRSRLMGWSETSGTAAIYTRRFIQRKATKALLAMQGGLQVGKVKP